MDSEETYQMKCILLTQGHGFDYLLFPIQKYWILKKQSRVSLVIILVFNIYISCIFLAQISKLRSLLTLPLVILQQWVIYVYLKIKINYMTMTLRRYWICSLFLSYMIFCASLRRFTFIDISIRICILILTQLMLHPLFRYILWWKDYFVINMFRMHYVVHMFISFSIMHCFISTSFWTLSKNLHVSNIILLFKTQ